MDVNVVSQPIVAPVERVAERWERRNGENTDWLVQRYHLEHNIDAPLSDLHKVMGTAKVILVDGYGLGGYQSTRGEGAVNSSLLERFSREGDEVLFPGQGAGEIYNQLAGATNVLEGRTLRVWEESTHSDQLVDGVGQRHLASIGAQIQRLIELERRSAEAAGEEKSQLEDQVKDAFAQCSHTLREYHYRRGEELCPSDKLVDAWLKCWWSRDAQLAELRELVQQRRESLISSVEILSAAIGRETPIWLFVSREVDTPELRGTLSDKKIPFLALTPKDVEARDGGLWREQARDSEVSVKPDKFEAFMRELSFDYPIVLEEVVDDFSRLKSPPVKAATKQD